MLDFFPNGGFASTTSKRFPGSAASAPDTLIGTLFSEPAFCKMSVQQQIHRAHPRRALHQIPTAESTLLQLALLLAREVRVVLRDVVVRREKKTARAAGRVAHRLAGLGRDRVHHRLDQRARREILARTRLRVLRVLLQQALVSVALHIRAHRRPVLLVDEVDDHAPQLGRVLTISTGDKTPAG